MMEANDPIQNGVNHNAKISNAYFDPSVLGQGRNLEASLGWGFWMVVRPPTMTIMAPRMDAMVTATFVCSPILKIRLKNL